MKSLSILVVSLLVSASVMAANTPPLSTRWNIAPSGSAASTGELLFRMTPGDGSDAVEVTVSVSSGTNEAGVARDIRQALGTQLARDRFNVQLGQGANVLVTDARGKTNFSLELLDSDVENLRVVVQSVDAAAPPTVPEQTAPATAPQTPASNTSSGNAIPATTPSPGNAGQPAAPPPQNAPPVPNGSPPLNTGDTTGQPAAAPPPNATPGGAPANAPPPGGK